MREHLRRVLDRMIVTWGMATTWRVHWQAMTLAMSAGQQRQGGRPDWTENVGRA